MSRPSRSGGAPSSSPQAPTRVPSNAPATSTLESNTARQPATPLERALLRRRMNRSTLLSLALRIAGDPIHEIVVPRVGTREKFGMSPVGYPASLHVQGFEQ